MTLIQILRIGFLLLIFMQPIRIGLYIAYGAIGKKVTDVTDYGEGSTVIAKIIMALVVMGWYWFLWEHVK